MCPTTPTRLFRLATLHFSGVEARSGNDAEIREFSFPITGESIMNTFSKYLSAAFLALSLLTAVGCASTAKSEGTGEYIDDTVITSKVKAAILGESTLKSAEINVETFKGIVQLSGFVSSQAAASKAVELARAVKGVSSVKNDMRIK
jgi:hyperosmotically inducible protein